jgi:hypothetical protein
MALAALRSSSVAEFATRGEPASRAELKDAEHRLGVLLPSDYAKFMLEGNGGTPTLTDFDVGPDIVGSVREFVQLDELRHAPEWADSVDEGLIAIAEDDFGNYVLLDCRGGRRAGVEFHHETREVTRLADSFTGFLELLREPSSDAVGLEGAEISIAPGFADELKAARQAPPDRMPPSASIEPS